jgi:hypothetical protein
MPPATLEIKNAAKAAPTGVPTSDAQRKPRFTRAEKRPYARDKKATQVQQAPKKETAKPKDTLRNIGTSQIDIIRLSPAHIDTYIALLEAKARVSSSKPKSLAVRIMRDNIGTKKAGEKPKKELSTAKLERIEKRRQLRTAVKEAWLAKKVADVKEREATEAAPAAAPAKSPVRTASTPRLASRRASVVARSPVRARSASIAATTLPYPEDAIGDLEY